MSTPAFTSAETDRVAPDPSKHVNYTQGMVLGVDDFTQEFAYLDNRDQWLAREAIGYGTITGLHVDSHLKDGSHEISVSPGVAISPRGQLIRVSTAQCAKIEAWLQLESTRTQLTERGIGASSAFNAYIVLCYRDCPVDELPVPGEPCRCDSETMAASRIQDDFRLELTLQAPPQKEEDAVRALVAWLRSLPVHDFNPASGEFDAFLDALRAEFQSLLSPPSSQLSPPSSPPVSIRIPRGQICEWMRAALRIWVTELRPIWQEQWRARSGSCHCGCGGDPTCHGTGAEIPEQGRECLLLARVSITRAAGAVTDTALNEDDRPFLVHLRMLQEVILCGRGRGLSLARTFGTAFTFDAHTIRLWLHYPEAVSVPEAAMTLWLNGVEQTEFSLSLIQSNVYDILLPASPPDLLAPGVTIELRLDAQLLVDPSGNDLATVFSTSWYRFNDYEEPTLRVFGYADTLPEIPLPNDAAIVAEDVFAATAKAPNAGTSPNFARADHTHGLPPNPIPPHVGNPTAHANHTLVGDVGGTLGANRINTLQGRPVDAASPAHLQVLQFVVPTTAGQQPRWMPQTQAPSATPNDALLKPENAFAANAILPNAGVSLNYARADHTHGLPPNPIPPHLNDVTGHRNHIIQGDVTRTLNTTFIAALQGIPVDAPNPQPDQVLQFDKTKEAWLAKDIAGIGNADAVLHPPGRGPYLIVAAGMLRRQPAGFTHSYNELRLATPPPTPVPNRLLITFGPAAPANPADGYMIPKTKHMYIVKGTSFGKIPCVFHVEGFDDNGIRILLMNIGDQASFERVMIEVSLFGAIE
jgi:hypothetical protein